MFPFQRLFRRKRKKDKAFSAPTTSLSTSASPVTHNDYTAYGLGSPPRGEHAVCCQKAEKRIAQDGLKKHLKNKQSGKARMLVFLYGRGFMVDSGKDTRVEKIEKIIGSPGASEILLRVLEADGDMDVTATFSSLYVNNMVVLKHYFEQEGSFGFLPDMTKAIYQFHRQKDGNCFLHGPSIFLPYLAQSQGVDDISAVDISKFVRRSISDEELYDYITKDNGGPSLHTLEKLLSPFKKEPKTFAAALTYPISRVLDRKCDLKTDLQDCGPGLVHNFNVHKNFNGDSHPIGKTGYLRFNGPCNAKGRFVEVHNGKEEIEMELETFLNDTIERSTPQPRNLANDGFSALTSTSTKSDRENHDSNMAGNDRKKGKAYEKMGTHAMILIGGRQDKEGKLWLLLQNWWDKMQLVEVSTEYFSASHALLSFVSDGTILKNADPGSLENCYEMNKFRVADCNNLDQPETRDGVFHIIVRDRAVVRTNACPKFGYS